MELGERKQKRKSCQNTKDWWISMCLHSRCQYIEHQTRRCLSIPIYYFHFQYFFHRSRLISHICYSASRIRIIWALCSSLFTFPVLFLHSLPFHSMFFGWTSCCSTVLLLFFWAQRVRPGLYVCHIISVRTGTAMDMTTSITYWLWFPRVIVSIFHCRLWKQDSRQRSPRGVVPFLS